MRAPEVDAGKNDALRVGAFARSVVVEERTIEDEHLSNLQVETDTFGTLHVLES